MECHQFEYNFSRPDIVWIGEAPPLRGMLLDEVDILTVTEGGGGLVEQNEGRLKLLEVGRLAQTLNSEKSVSALDDEVQLLTRGRGMTLLDVECIFKASLDGVAFAVEGRGPTGRLEDSETGFRRMAQLAVELDGVGKLPGLELPRSEVTGLLRNLGARSRFNQACLGFVQAAIGASRRRSIEDREEGPAKKPKLEAGAPTPEEGGDRSGNVYGWVMLPRPVVLSTPAGRKNRESGVAIKQLSVDLCNATSKAVYKEKFVALAGHMDSYATGVPSRNSL